MGITWIIRIYRTNLNGTDHLEDIDVDGWKTFQRKSRCHGMCFVGNYRPNYSASRPTATAN